MDLSQLLLIVALILFICIGFSKISGKTGIPGLFIFIVLGMIFGLIFQKAFEFSLANSLCSVALIFIMFYGGVGTKWSKAKPVAKKAIVLSSLGTILTAFFVGMFCFLVLQIPILESLLIGSVICSTDAASVFSILRSKKMNLKYGTASMIEVESGSNDPFSYMLTIIILSIMSNQGVTPNAGQIILQLVLQVVLGVGFGVFFALIARFVLKKFKFKENGFDLAFLVAIAVITYALPTVLGGNGYLAVYITGIIIGNSNILVKKNAFHFFDGITSIIQMLMFFLLGLLCTPANLIKVEVFGIGLLVALFLTFVGRPLAVFISMTIFKAKPKQQVLVAWTGMRGVASIVFSIIAVTTLGEGVLEHDLFHIVFFIVLFSILLQGTLLPIVAKKLDMIDYEDDVMKTFNDYMEEVPVQFIQFALPKNHEWLGKKIKEITLPPDSLLVLVVRGKRRIIPNGNTKLQESDVMILSGKDSSKVDGINLYEKVVDSGDLLVNKKIKDIKIEGKLIILIKRKNNVIIPKGDTYICEGDTLVINDTK